MSLTSRDRTYTELITISSYEARFEYLALRGSVGRETFGFERWMNQSFYNSTEWRNLRHHIIARDEGLDLGCPGYEIHDKLLIHHIVPMTVMDFENGNPLILDPDNLITTTHQTHNAIHYGDARLLNLPPTERRPGDTLPWNR